MFLKSNYERSNAITSVHFSVNDDARRLTGALMLVSTTNDRQPLAEALLDELADCAGIDICRVKISDTQQYHRRRHGRTVFKQYGYYRPQSNYIYIQNLTAVRAQTLASKTFLDTLLHEWTHHYDTRALNLVSIHTAGFYQRLGSLKTKLGITVNAKLSSTRRLIWK